jgi:hypothetical protein
MHLGHLAAHLQRMRHDEVADAALAEAPSSVGQSRYPHAPIVAETDTVRFWYRAKALLPTAKGLTLLTTGVALVGLVMAAALLLRPRTYDAYMLSTQPLSSEASAESAAQPLALLERGEKVTVFDAVGGYAMVRDALGRSGFVLRSFVGEDAPASFPELPFVGCRRSQADVDGRECAARAEQQRDSCRAVCDVAA